MLKVAIIGPESTGKSELSEKLAIHFNGDWVPEYAREYVERLNKPYDFDDICNIAHTQIEQELRYEQLNKSGFVFFDTELIITKVWMLHVYKQCPDFVTERLSAPFFDFYLLCKPDLPWIEDPVREHGTDREFFYEWYKKEIETMHKPYCEISGSGAERTNNAIKEIENYFGNKII